MKILKIDNGKGFYSLDETTWKQIDEIDKNDLMALLNIVLKEDARMDAYSSDAIANQAHQIIYKSIYEKLHTLLNNKSKFKDESDRLYLEAIQKYSL
ncbi:MAG TPA: hypothetical protein PL180_04565 [Spirochaetota bacterium]|nr:hypothetical protein [Spirochaetota bacterium]